jgi:predicted ATPase
MVALYRCGRQADALRAYQAARATLAEELGLEPGPELRRLEAAVLAQDPELDLAGPPAAEGPRRTTNIGAPLNAFVGRETDLSTLRELLGRHRLVTALGTGGAGKTRLAVELATQLVPQMRDGAWLVDLAPLGDGTAVAPAMAAALGLPELGTVGVAEGAVPIVDRLVDYLANKHALTVIDNCEHVVDEVAAAVASLLAACPRLTILATSREALGVPGEALWSVPPMVLRDAVELFRTRAAATVPGFELSADIEPAVIDICQRLDGLPLAIELAVVRLRTLSVRELAARLDDRFRLLTGGARTALPRHQTLRAVIDWSYELLSDDEQQVLDRLSVFADGCSLRAAERVCSGGPVAAHDVVDLLARLVERSLVTADTSTRLTRYRLLQTIALYGRERLDATGQTPEVRDLHAACYAELCSRSTAAWRGKEQRHWLREVAAERGNIRAAFDWSVARGHAQRAAAMAGDLGWYWWLTGRVVEGSECLDAALATHGDVDPPTRAQALCWAAQLEADLRLGEEAVAVYRGTDDREGLALATMMFGRSLLARGDLARAEEVLVEAACEYDALDGELSATTGRAVAAHLALLSGRRDEAESLMCACAEEFASLGDEWAAAMSLEAVAYLAEQRGAAAEAAVSLRAAGDLARELGLMGFEAGVLARLGTIAASQEQWAEADRLHQEALRLSHEVGFKAGVALTLNGIAFSRRARGHLDEAVACAEEALDLYVKADLAGGAAAALGTLGFAAEERGDVEAARRLHLAGLDQAKRVPGPLATAVALAGLAGAAAAGGDARTAGLLLGAAGRPRRSVPWPPPSRAADIDRVSATASAVIGSAAFQQAVAEGHNAPLDELLEQVS